MAQTWNQFIREGYSRFKAKNEFEFLTDISVSGKMAINDISTKFSNGHYLIKKWIKAGVIESYNERVFRDPVGNIFDPFPEPKLLFNQQKTVLKEILADLDKHIFSTSLLNGVTGSGKN